MQSSPTARLFLSIAAGFLALGAGASGWLIYQSRAATTVASPMPSSPAAAPSLAPSASNQPAPSSALATGPLPLWNVGDVTGTCEVDIDGTAVIAGPCAGRAGPDTITKQQTVVLGTEHDGCTLELTPRGPATADIKIYGYRDHCWLDEAAGREIESDISLGTVHGADGCWRNNAVTLCYTAVRFTEPPSPSSPRPSLTFDYLAGTWEQAAGSECGTPYAVIYRPDGTSALAGQRSSMAIHGDRLTTSSPDGRNTEVIRPIDANHFLSANDSDPGWVLMRRCPG